MSNPSMPKYDLLKSSARTNSRSPSPDPHKALQGARSNEIDIKDILLIIQIVDSLLDCFVICFFGNSILKILICLPNLSITFRKEMLFNVIGKNYLFFALIHFKPSVINDVKLSI